MWYYQINTFPRSAAYSPHIKERVCVKQENNWEIKHNPIMTGDLSVQILHITDNVKAKIKKQEYILGMIKEYPNLYCLGY
jgi:hypothetical protein